METKEINFKVILQILPSEDKLPNIIILLKQIIFVITHWCETPDSFSGKSIQY